MPALKMLLAVGLALPATAASGQETVRVKSKALDRAEVTLDVKLHLPKGAGPFPAVVVVNSSGGARDRVLAAAPPAFTKRGVAVAVVDTYTPRGIADTVTDQAKLSSWHMAADALHVAQALRNDKRIRPDRIAMMGHSKGGIVAFNLAFRFTSKFFDSALRKFDAYLPMAPSCAIQFPEKELNGPTNVMLAEKDEMTPAQPCVRLFQDMKNAGEPISFTVVPAANHNWSTRDWVYMPDVYTVRKCMTPVIMVDLGRFRDETGRIFAGNEVIERCGERGAHVGGNFDRLTLALESHVQFLKSLGW